MSRLKNVIYEYAHRCKSKDQRYIFSNKFSENNNESEYYEEIKESTPNKVIMIGIYNILSKM